jgi:hypothetical protein
MKAISRPWISLFGLALALVIAACGAADQEQDDFPFGVYKSGVRVFELMDDGKFTFGVVEGQPVVEGSISIDGQEITFSDEVSLGGADVEACPDAATYRWAFNAESLTLEMIGEDPCPERAAGFTLTYRRVE